MGRNVLMVEHSQGRLPDISGTLTLLMVLGFSSQSSRPAGRAWSAGDQPLYHASQDEPKVKLRGMEFPMRPLHVSGIRLQTPPRGPHSRRGTRDLEPGGGRASFLRRSARS